MELWLREPLTQDNRILLQNYATYVNHLSGLFSITSKPPSISGPREKRRIKNLIGYIPQQELLICGYADYIFQASEEILSLFEGYLKTRMPDEELINYQGKEYIIKTKPSGQSYFQVYHLIKIETIRGYFNGSIPEEIKRIGSLKSFNGAYFAGN